MKQIPNDENGALFVQKRAGLPRTRRFDARTLRAVRRLRLKRVSRETFEQGLRSR